METRKYYDYQQAFNATWKTMLTEAFSDHFTSERLAYCNAIVYNSARYKVLQSYSTIVAIFDCEEDTLFVLGYYSATTAQHIAKFCKQHLPATRTAFFGEAMYGNMLAYGAGFHGVWKKSKNNSLFFRRDDGTRYDGDASGLFAAVAYHA